MLNPPQPSPADLLPHLLYRTEGEAAQFATWQLTDGHEALAIFTSPAAAAGYQAELPAPGDWQLYLPPRETLIEILQACVTARILYAALDPLGGQAKTLFDIPRVLEAGRAAIQ